MTSVTELKNDELVRLYVALRDDIAKEKADYENRVADRKAKQLKIEGILLKRLQDAGDEAVRTKYGTAYKNIRTSASVADWDSLLNFVKQEEAWELLTRGVNKTVVEQHVAANGDLPPGVNWGQEVTIGVQRA